MTQLFDEAGRVTPVTVIEAAPNTVTNIKTTDTNGYAAVQVGFEEQKESRASKAVLGAFGGKAYKVVKEFRVNGSQPEVAVGDTILVSAFSRGDEVTVSGTSKAKGFEGVVKRHVFHGGPRSTGGTNSYPRPRAVRITRCPRPSSSSTLRSDLIRVVSADSLTNLLPQTASRSSSFVTTRPCDATSRTRTSNALGST